MCSKYISVALEHYLNTQWSVYTAVLSNIDVSALVMGTTILRIQVLLMRLGNSCSTNCKWKLLSECPCIYYFFGQFKINYIQIKIEKKNLLINTYFFLLFQHLYAHFLVSYRQSNIYIACWKAEQGHEMNWS